MKVLQINSHYNQGGAARIAAYIHRQLLEEGVESYVAYGRGALSEDKNVWRFDHTWEIYLSALLSRLTGINGWFNRRATKRLIKRMEEIQPDVIHMHALHGYYLNFPMLFRYINEKKIPCVWTFHDCHAFVGNCGYFFDCDKWQHGCGKCPYVHGYPKSQFFDFTAWMWKRKRELFTKGAEKVIVTPSEWLTNEAKKSFVGKYPCVTIHNGIDSTRIFYPRDIRKCREKHGYHEEDRIVLGIAVGYSDPRKGAKYMLQMAKDLQQDPLVKVILIGWEQTNDNMLKGIANVEALPAVADTETLAEYYSMADVFVLTSLAENYATVNLEAMACGTPVVGFDCGGTPEQLTGGKGIAVPTANQEALTNAVRKVLDYAETLPGEAVDEESCSPDGQNGVSDDGIQLLRGEKLAEKIRTENSLEKMTYEYVALYQSLV